MATLFLSCNTGQGHNSCAMALKEYYEAQGEVCAMEDALSFISQSLSDFIGWGHITIYRHFHKLFRIGYRYSEKHSGMFQENSPVYHLLSKGTERMYQYIKDGGFDTVICTHVFASLMVTEVQKKHDLPLSTCLVATDYTCNPGTKESMVDRYFIPAPPLSVYYECPSIDDQQIISSGIPIRQMFYRHTAKEEAKLAYGISAGNKHLIMMCGSMGCGPMKKLTKELAPQLGESMDLTIVCGTNTALEKKLRKRYARFSHVHILGYVEDMSKLMDSADLYLTKPGGISVTEAAMKNLPMVFIDAVAGCEEYNKIFFIKKQAAKTETTTDGLANICLELMRTPAKLEAMHRNLAVTPKNNASKVIFDEMAVVKGKQESSPLSRLC